MDNNNIIIPLRKKLKILTVSKKSKKSQYLIKII